jgi:hypothetical protein
MIYIFEVAKRLAGWLAIPIIEEAQDQIRRRREKEVETMGLMQRRIDRQQKFWNT